MKRQSYQGTHPHDSDLVFVVFKRIASSHLQMKQFLRSIPHLDDAKNRLIYIEKEFEQLKHDYYDLNIKQKELLNTCRTLENENQNLLQTIEQIDREKAQLKETHKRAEEKFSNEIKQLNEFHEKQQQELLYSTRQTDSNETDLKQNLESLQTRINNYENAVSQYEEYRLKLENNLDKITQQRDTNKMDLRLTKEMLTNKENDFNQLKFRLEETEKNFHSNKERLIQNETSINDLQKQIKQYEQQIFELNQTKLKDVQVRFNKTISNRKYSRRKDLILSLRNLCSKDHDLLALKVSSFSDELSFKNFGRRRGTLKYSTLVHG
jgi:chromosome segregation ATPase